VGWRGGRDKGVKGRERSREGVGKEKEKRERGGEMMSVEEL
jgi:hypothetical protein